MIHLERKKIPACLCPYQLIAKTYHALQLAEKEAFFGPGYFSKKDTFGTKIIFLNYHFHIVDTI
jgi:hypothetical protein